MDWEPIDTMIKVGDLQSHPRDDEWIERELMGSKDSSVAGTPSSGEA